MFEQRTGEPCGCLWQLYSRLVVAIVQLLSCVQRFVTPWTATCQATLSFLISRSLLKLMPIDLVRPSNHLILCCPLFLLPLIFPSIRVFSNESALCIKWPKYWSFSFSVSPSNVYSRYSRLKNIKGKEAEVAAWLANSRVARRSLWLFQSKPGCTG